MNRQGLWMLVALLSAGCVTEKQTTVVLGGTTETEAPDATGEWTGACEPLVTESGYTHALTLEISLTEEGGVLSGTALLIESDYTEGPYTLEGVREGAEVVLDFVDTDYEVAFEAMLDGDSLEGTLSIQSDPLSQAQCSLGR